MDTKLNKEQKAEIFDLTVFFNNIGGDVDIDSSEVTLSYELTHSHFMFSMCDPEIELPRMRNFIYDAYKYFKENTLTLTHEEAKSKGINTTKWFIDQMNKNPEKRIRIIPQEYITYEENFIKKLKEKINE